MRSWNQLVRVTKVSPKCPGSEEESRFQAIKQQWGVQNQSQGVPKSRKEADPAVISLSGWGFSRYISLGFMGFSSCAEEGIWGIELAQAVYIEPPGPLGTCYPDFLPFPSAVPLTTRRRNASRCTIIVSQSFSGRDRKWRIIDFFQHFGGLAIELSTVRRAFTSFDKSCHKF